MMKVYKRYENSTFENFETSLDIEFLKKPRELTQNVIITGGVGLGKTHLAYAIINQEAEKKTFPDGSKFYFSSFVHYASIKEIIDNIKALWRTGADATDKEIVDNYKNIPLLIIDEIGVQYGSDSERIELYEIFNERYCQMLPTIAISNYNKQQISKTLGLRITDRLFGSAKILELEGESKR